MSAKHVILSLIAFCVAVLSASQRAVAQQSTAWLYAFQEPPATTDLPWSMGIASHVALPSNAILGHLPHAGAVGEVAVAQAIISVGDQVPLPSYADGSQAQESEVFWTAQLWRAEFFAGGVIRYRQGDYALAVFSGRQLVSAEAQINTGGAVPPPFTNLQVLVNVIAFRAHDHRRLKSSDLAPSKQQSMGSIKARYR